jgi:hypothetical protein
MNTFARQRLKLSGLAKKKGYDSTSSSTTSPLMLPNEDDDNGAEAESALISNLERKSRSNKFAAFHRAHTVKRLASNRNFGSAWNAARDLSEISPLTPTDQLFNYADQVQELFDVAEDKVEDKYMDEDNQALGHDARGGFQPFDDEEELPRFTTPLLLGSGAPLKSRIFANQLQTLCHKAIDLFVEILQNLIHFLIYSMILIIVPLMLTAYALFYYFKNPELEFLPSKVSLSWWLIFACRQVITFNLAKSIHFVVLKLSLNRGIVFFNIVGPIVTVLIIQSSGWPFLLFTWGILDLIFLHGSGPFVQDWLYMFNIPMFSSSTNPDFGLLADPFYLRILLSSSFLGLLGGLKRTYVALLLGKRMQNHFKPQMVELVVYMDLLAEVADLAFELNKPGFLESLNILDVEDFITLNQQREKKVTVLQKVIGKNNIENKLLKKNDDNESDEEYNDKIPMKSPIQIESEGNSSNSDSANKKIDWSLLQKQVALEKAHSSNSHLADVEESGEKQFDSNKQQLDDEGGRNKVTFDFPSENNTPAQSLFRARSSSKMKIKDLLDRWTEPDNRYDKVSKFLCNGRFH